MRATRSLAWLCGEGQRARSLFVPHLQQGAIAGGQSPRRSITGSAPPIQVRMPELEAILDAIVHLDPTPLLLAILVGGLIGMEREIHGRPAGFRTHIMVCLSSTLLIRASQVAPALAPIADSGLTLVWDPNRLAAGVVTGIGFLGAAAVIRSGDIVRGITTGACVWAVAVLGVVIGHGAYALAIAGSVSLAATVVQAF